jgi:hypothetical protein
MKLLYLLVWKVFASLVLVGIIFNLVVYLIEK